MSSSARALGIMQGTPPAPGKRPTLENWDLAPFNRWSFQNVRMVLPTAAIRRGPGPASHLPRDHQGLDDLAVAGADGTATTLAGLLEASECDGFLVLHRGRIVHERYLNAMQAHTLHLSQSVGKSFVSTLVGILWGRGLLDLEKPVSHYLPELAGRGYADALLWQVLDMRSGVKFNEEDYGDLDAEIGMLDRAAGWKPHRAGQPETVIELIEALVQERPHGGHFVYRSIETEVLGWLVARVAGMPLVEVMSRELWGPMGAEFDADFTVDRDGTALASGGLNAALRDYGRFGQLFLDQGCIEGRQVVPAEWVAQCRRGDRAAFAVKYADYFPSHPEACYSRQWWVLDPSRGRHVALGIFGQMVWVDPADRLVVVALSTWPDYLDPARRGALFKACEAIGRALNGWS